MKPNFSASLLLYAAGALSLGALGATAIKFHADAAALRDEASRLATERSALQAHRGELLQHQRQLAGQVRELRATAAAETKSPGPVRNRAVADGATVTRSAAGGTPVATAPDAAEAGRRPREPMGPHGNVYFPELLGEPEYSLWFKTYSAPHIEERYAVLFHDLRLPPDQRARLKDLLIQLSLAQDDVDGILEIRAMQERTDVSLTDKFKIQRTVVTQIEAEIQATLGDAIFAMYRRFSNSLGIRQTLEPAFLRLSYTQPALRLDQEETLVKLFDEVVNGPRRAALVDAARNRTRPEILSTPGNRFTDAFIAQAQTILTAEQVDGLRQVQTEQLALVSGSMSIRPASTGSLPSATPPPRPPGGG
jgi:hypothetical protein